MPGNTYDFLDEIYLALHNDSTLILKMGNEKNFCDSRSNLANSIWQRGVVATVFSHSELSFKNMHERNPAKFK